MKIKCDKCENVMDVPGYCIGAQVKCVKCSALLNLNGRDFEKLVAKEDDCTGFALAILSFFIPLVGFIMGAIFISKPEKHNQDIGASCLIGAVLGIVLCFFAYFVLLCMM